MNKQIRRAVLGIIAVSIIVPSSIWTASDTSVVQVDGDKLTVHAANVALRDLLMSVSKKTGVQFIINEGLAEEYVSLDFEGLPLAIGVEKIVHPYNHAVINDEVGKLSKVYVFSKGKAGSRNASIVKVEQKGKSVPRDTAELNLPSDMDHPKDHKHGDQMGGQSPGLKNDSRYFPGPPVDQPYTGKGPAIADIEEMPGPPDIQGPDRPPPISEMKEMAGPPDIHMPKSYPPAKSETGRQ